jgi:hypothetical protein
MFSSGMASNNATIGVALTAAVALGACAPDDSAKNDVVRIVTPLYLTHPKWPTGTSGVAQIPVCLDQNVGHPSAHAADNAVRVRAKLKATWSAVAKIDFTGFGTCGTNRNGMIVMHLVNGGLPIVDGKPAAGITAPLGYPGANAHTDLSILCDKSVPSGSIDEAAAVHEFGHALGFSHEQDRPDFTDTCLSQTVENGGNTLDTPPDPPSIMSSVYCNILGPADLSFWDVWGVQIAYGARYGAFAQLASATNSGSPDHLTGISADRSFADPASYKWTYSEGWIYTKQAPQTVPLVLYRSAARGDYFTTATAVGFASAAEAGYSAVRVEGYVYPTQQPGTIPLNLFWNGSRQDNFTTSNPQAQADALAAGYVFVRTEGFIFGGFHDASTGQNVGTIVAEPYVPVWWLNNPSTGDNVSVSLIGGVSFPQNNAISNLLFNGYNYVAADAAFLRFNVPGTTRAEIFKDSANGNEFVLANADDQSMYTNAGFTYVPNVPAFDGTENSPAYLFTAQYDFGPAANVALYRLFRNNTSNDRFTTSWARSTPASSDISLDFQGFGFSQDPVATGFQGGANEIYDGGTQCTVGGITMHCCPNGYAMIGANLGTNVFKCVQTGLAQAKFLGSNSDTGSTWNCGSVSGAVMVGFHAGANTAACQISTVLATLSNASVPYVDRCTYDATSMRVCPFQLGGVTSVLGGIDQNNNNALTCLNPNDLIPAILSGPACRPIVQQSSSLPGFNDGPDLAVDGNTDGNFWHGSVTHSNCQQGDWWSVDLGAPHIITGVTIYNRTDCCSERLGNFNVSHALPFQNWTLDITDTDSTLGVGTIPLNLVSVSGQSLLIQKNDSNCLSLAEVQVMGF